MMKEGKMLNELIYINIYPFLFGSNTFVNKKEIKQVGQLHSLINGLGTLLNRRPAVTALY